MWDVNPQTHANYLRDIERQFAKSAKSAAPRQPGPRFKQGLHRLATGFAPRVATLAAIWVVAGFFIG